MSQKHSIYTRSVKATADFSEYLAVGYDGGLAAPGGVMLGLGTTEAEIGAMLAVDVLGTSIGIAGAAIAKDDDLEVGANGQLITHTSGVVVARAMEGAAVAGAELEVMLLPK